MRRSLPFLIIGAVLAVALGASVVLFRYRMEPAPAPPPPAPTPVSTTTPLPRTIAPSAPTAPLDPSATSTPRTPVTSPTFTYGRPGAEPLHIRGDPAAPVVLEEFGDFECLPCSIVWPLLEKLENDYGNRLVVVFRQHPLKKHRYALDAARAAEAAGLQDKFWEMHDTLYRNRATWVPADYVGPHLNSYATELGLDLERFKTDMDGEAVAKRIAADQDRGDSLNIDRTPILFINGEQIAPTARDEKGLRAAIDKALGSRPQ
ncbi:MAG: DsbA family protein [Verrucomicrobiota bacterium]|nr:DsbA family protein [Verrucomicrobiota bacterium]